MRKRRVALVRWNMAELRLFIKDKEGRVRAAGRPGSREASIVWGAAAGCLQPLSRNENSLLKRTVYK